MLKVQETFNEISREFSDSRAFPGKEFELFKAYLQPGQTIVDIGCGNGRLLQFLEKEANNWHQPAFYYIGIDNSRNLLEEAKKKYPDRAFKYGDQTKIPLKDKSADILFSIRALHHVPSQKMQLKVLNEMKRVLKNNGILVITVWNLLQRRYWKKLFKAAMRSIITFGTYRWRDVFIPWGRLKKPRYYHAFTRRSLENLVKKAGFQILECYGDHNSQIGHDIILIAKK